MKTDREDSFERSYQLSKQHVDDAISPHEVAEVLNELKVKYVLIGGHVLGYFTGSPRATVDVDVMVSMAQASKAVRAIESKFPHLESRDLAHNVRFSSRQEGSNVDAERIDVVRARDPFFQRILSTYAVPLQSRGRILHVPTAEAAVALKFAAAISPNRGDESRPQDRADLVSMIRKQPELKTQVLSELGDLIYPGGGKELIDFVEAVRLGKRAVL